MALTHRPSARALMSKAADIIQERFDGWANVLTGLGGAHDKRQYARLSPGMVLDEYTLATLYHHEWLARTICEILPEKAMRAGMELVVPDGGEDLETRIDDRMEELDAWSKLCTAAIWGRLYGAGAVLVGVSDGRGVDQPLNLEAVQRVDYMVPLDRRSLVIERWYSDPASPKFAQPELYKLQRRVSGRTAIATGEQATGALIHESRMLVFGGARTGDEEKVANQGWDYSVLQAVYDVLRDWGLSWAGAGMLLQEASQAVYSVKDLTKMLARADGEQALQRRFRIIEMGRSIARALVIDADGEAFERKATTFTGVPDMLDRFCNLLAAATRIPVTVLMGTAPAGLNATGESDLLTFQSTVEEWQTQVLAPRVEHLVRLLLREGGQAEPESWKVKLCYGTAETPKAAAERRLVVAQADAIYVDKGVVLPEEIGLSRFGAEGWSPETQIDLDLRRDVAELKEEGLREAAESGGSSQQLGTAGAQVEGLDKITASVVAGDITLDAAVARVVALFGMTEEQARAVLGEIEVAPEPDPTPVVGSVAGPVVESGPSAPLGRSGVAGPRPPREE